jgi:DNA invertase Pin-like site-specific DNA recombinase
MGDTVVEVFQENASGAKVDRAVRARVIAGAKAHAFDAILVTEPSRWSRSLVDLVTGLEELARYGVSLISQNGMSLDISTAAGRMLVGVMGSLAEFERDLIRERILSGIAAARRKGRVFGRPKGFSPPKAHDANVMRLLENGMSVRDTAKALNISATTVQAAKRRASAVVVPAPL